MNDKEFEEWGVVEVMGHRRFAGHITEQTIGGSSFVRVDVPAVGDRQAFTKILGSGSIYAITPTSEDVARRIALNIYDEPINRYELRLPEPQKQLDMFEDEDAEEMGGYIDTRG